MIKKGFSISAPGKIILSGEHAVVYGYPALVSAVNKRLTVISQNSRFEINSEIPIGSGMGSSAACAVAKSAAKTYMKTGGLNLEKINNLAYKMEKRHHGNPSGADNTISTYGGYLWYRKESESVRLFSSLRIKRKLPEIYILDTGRPEESTKEMVDIVRNLCLKRPKLTEQTFKEIEEITRFFLKYLMGEENPSIRELFKTDQKLLESLGVVSSTTKKLVRQIENMGGAAKISGAGGWKKASGIVLVYHEDTQKLKDFTNDNNIDLMAVGIGEEGVKINGEN